MNSSTSICRTIILATLLSGSVAMYSAEYATKRLQRIAGQIEKRHPKYAMTTRTNEWGETEHIGLRLFSESVRKLHPSPTYDFLERHLLELNLAKGTEEEIILLQKPVYFTIGTYLTALQVDSTLDFRNEEIEFHKYRSTWSKDGRDVLQLIYDMDYQLMSGCNISELEEMFIKRLKRHKVEYVDTLPENGTYIIASNINNSVHIDHSRPKHKDNQCRNYIFDTKQASRSVANLMLAEDLPVDVDLQLRINRYDYKSDTLNVTLKRYLNFCRAAESCTPYFAIKYRTGDSFEGLLLFANRDSGYMHMLTVTIGPEIIEHGKGTIYGRMIVYIPLHNVKQEYLNLTEYETIQ